MVVEKGWIGSFISKGYLQFQKKLRRLDWTKNKVSVIHVGFTSVASSWMPKVNTFLERFSVHNARSLPGSNWYRRRRLRRRRRIDYLCVVQQAFCTINI